MPRPRVGVVGAGHVGETVALGLVQAGVCDVVISDIIQGMPSGKGLDMSQSRAVEGRSTTVIGTDDVGDMKDCPVIVIAAGVPRKPGMSPEQLQDVNATVIRDVCGRIRELGTDPVLIVVTDPIDVMTHAVLRVAGFPRSRVLGVSGVLHASRLAHFVAEKLRISPRDVSAMVLGSHGEAMVAIPRLITVSGIPLQDLMSREDIEECVERVRQAGAEIIRRLKTGSAYFTPAASVRAMAESVLLDQDRILSCAVRLEGEYGLENVVVGVPCRLGAGGLKQIIEMKLAKEEQELLRNAAGMVEKNCGLLRL